MIKRKNLYLLFFLLGCYLTDYAKEKPYTSINCLIINIDTFSGNMLKAVDANGKEIYVLNSRYKLNKNLRSRIQDDADFMFTFYVLPNKKISLIEINDLSKILLKQIKSIDEIKSLLLSQAYDDYYPIEPILKLKDKYYKFKDCLIFGQAFDLQENSQYFPKYGAGSNRFELNLLAKPYSLETIESLRKVISKDTTALVRFGTYVEDFYDKWFISSINRDKKTIDFWIDLKTIYDSGFSFGRVTSAITYKIGVGITDFKIIPFSSEIKESYFSKYNLPIQFHFKEFIELRSLLINH